MKSRALIAAALLLMAGCASSPTSPARPPAYGDGYKDGCESGQASQGVFGRNKQDPSRFGSDTQYARGWTDGFKTCEEEEFRRNSAGGL